MFNSWQYSKMPWMQRCRQHLLIGVSFPPWCTVVAHGCLWWMIRRAEGPQAKLTAESKVQPEPSETLTAAPVACDLRCVEEGLFVFETASLANSRTPFGDPLDEHGGPPTHQSYIYIYIFVIICHYLSLFVVSGETNGCGVYTPNMSANIFRGQAAFF